MSKHIIVGGGINGLFTSYFLTKSGQTVTLVERGQIGQESSWAGGGILCPLYPWRYADSVNQLVGWSQTHYPEIVAELIRDTGIDPELLDSGLLVLAEPDPSLALSWARRFKQRILPLDPETCAGQFPQIRCGKAGALWMPDIRQVRNPRLVKALITWLDKNGAEIIRGEEVRDLRIENAQIKGIITNNQSLSADSVCLTTGAWMQGLLAKLDLQPDITPVKGQMLLLHSTPDLINHIILKDSHYIIPRKDGRILVGSTLERAGFDKSTTQDAKEELLRSAYSLLPKLQNYKIERHWAGLRPGSKDGVPTICEHPEISGLFLNGGQFRNGVVMAPASGQLMTNIMLGQPAIADSGLYQLVHTDAVSGVH